MHRIGRMHVVGIDEVQVAVDAGPRIEKVEVFALHENLLQGQHPITEFDAAIGVHQCIQRPLPQQDLATATQHQQQVDSRS